MLLLACFSFVIGISIGSETHHGHSTSNSTNGHIAHSHTSTVHSDCACISGLNNVRLDAYCSNSGAILALEDYLRDNKCHESCAGMAYIGTTSANFMCFQAYTALVQFGDRCETGTVNQTLLSLYLEVCPDCLQQHHVFEEAVDCDHSIDCTDADDQNEVIEYVTENCVESCDAAHCEERWLLAEGYHRMCFYDVLTNAFSNRYVVDVERTVCEDIGCNVPWERENYDCGSSVNHAYEHLLLDNGEFTMPEAKSDEDSSAWYFQLTVTLVVASFLSVYCV